MKIGFCTEYSEEKVRFAKEAGFDCLEIFLGPGSNLDIHNFPNKEKKAVRDAFTKYKIEIADFICSVNHLEPDEKRREENNNYFLKAIDLCKEFGVKILATNTWGDKTKTVKENLSVYKKVFSKYAKKAEEDGIKIAMENCPHLTGYPFHIQNIGYSPVAWELMFEAVPSKAIGLEFDPSHLVWLGIDYIKGIYDFGDRIYCCHAKDTEILKKNLVREGIFGENWWRYRIPGWGDINWQKFISALLDVNYDGPIIIEHEDPVFGGTRTNEGLILGLRHLRQFVAKT